MKDCISRSIRPFCGNELSIKPEISPLQTLCRKIFNYRRIYGDGTHSCRKCTMFNNTSEDCTTYGTEREPEDIKKTVAVVKKLTEKYEGSFRTINVDRFYTSVDLLKSLTDRQLFLTGTVLSNRIPLSIRTTKTSSTFKKMNRGDAIKCSLTYKTDIVELIHS